MRILPFIAALGAASLGVAELSGVTIVGNGFSWSPERDKRSLSEKLSDDLLANSDLFVDGAGENAGKNPDREFAAFTSFSLNEEGVAVYQPRRAFVFGVSDFGASRGGFSLGRVFRSGPVARTALFTRSEDFVFFDRSSGANGSSGFSVSIDPIAGIVGSTTAPAVFAGAGSFGGPGIGGGFSPSIQSLFGADDDDTPGSETSLGPDLLQVSVTDSITETPLPPAAFLFAGALAAGGLLRRRSAG